MPSLLEKSSFAYEKAVFTDALDRCAFFFPIQEHSFQILASLLNFSLKTRSHGPLKHVHFTSVCAYAGVAIKKAFNCWFLVTIFNLKIQSPLCI